MPIGNIMKFIVVLILLMLSEQGKTIAQIATDESKYKTESSFDKVCAYHLLILTFPLSLRVIGAGVQAAESASH